PLLSRDRRAEGGGPLFPIPGERFRYHRAGLILQSLGVLQVADPSPPANTLDNVLRVVIRDHFAIGIEDVAVHESEWRRIERKRSPLQLRHLHLRYVCHGAGSSLQQFMCSTT